MGIMVPMVNILRRETVSDGPTLQSCDVRAADLRDRRDAGMTRVKPIMREEGDMAFGNLAFPFIQFVPSHAKCHTITAFPPDFC